MLALTTQAGDRAGDDTVLAAAGVWSRAVARRDGGTGPVDVDAAVPGLRRRLALDGSTLLTAHRDKALVGFALFAPGSRGLELYYLAVDPADWGGGVGSALLRAVDGHARAAGSALVELWVIDDNTRAIEVYQRNGWVSTDEVVTDPTSRRDERRFVRRRS